MKKHEGGIKEKDSETEIQSSSTSIEIGENAELGSIKPVTLPSNEENRVLPEIVSSEIRNCASTFSRTLQQQRSTISSKSNRKTLIKNLVDDVIDLTIAGPATSSQVQHQQSDSSGTKLESDIGSSNRELVVYRSLVRNCVSSFSRTLEKQRSTTSSKSYRRNLVKNVVNDVIDLAIDRPTTSSQLEQLQSNSQTMEPEIGNSNREYQVYRSVAGGIINSTNALHEEHMVRQTGSLKSLRIPPSYSQVVKMGRALPCPNSQIDAYPSAPFIYRQPPPSYAEVQGAQSEELSMYSDESYIFGPDPVYMICPRCRTMVYTEVRTEISTLSHVISAALCICLCWPCFWIPYCLKSCRFSYHTCPRCHHYFGMYQPW